MDSTKKRMLSLVIPVFNEQEVLKDSFARMDAAMQSTGYAYEIIYVNDGSRDHTLDQLRELANEHKQVKVLSFSVAHAEGTRHWVHLALARLETRLDPAKFVRIHRTHIVNLDFVVAFKRHGRSGMTAELRNGVRLAVSRQRAVELRKLGM